MSKVSVDGVEIAYAEAGSGLPVLFVHGYPLNKSMWDPQVQELSRDYRCITVDLRGHGESDAPLWYATMDMFANDLAKLLDHLNVPQAVICGFSMGGYVAFAFYRQFRERVRALILADTRPQADTPEARQGRFAAAQTAHRQGVGAIADAMVPRLLSPASVQGRPDLVQRVRAIIESMPVTGIAADLMAMAQRPDSTPLLPEIRCPTLIIVGEEDAITPVADSQLMAERIPGAQLVTIPGAGHLANLEQPEAFNRAVRDFLQKLPS